MVNWGGLDDAVAARVEALLAAYSEEGTTGTPSLYLIVQSLTGGGTVTPRCNRSPSVRRDVLEVNDDDSPHFHIVRVADIAAPAIVLPDVLSDPASFVVVPSRQQ